ncbi:hypothetical protein VZT92_023948 [Zoarces viviparus]|uniref:Uncharacterized protein n=1 Tax=Zoarces viviparus TaxID=48416 RepID=A0AAW1E6S0_ZOAVI
MCLIQGSAARSEARGPEEAPLNQRSHKVCHSLRSCSFAEELSSRRQPNLCRSHNQQAASPGMALGLGPPEYPLGALTWTTPQRDGERAGSGHPDTH